MTNKTDNYKSRVEKDAAGEATVGIPIDGFADPAGEFPKRDYFYGSSVNVAARGIKINTLSLRGSDLSVSIDLPPQKASTFPFNDVRETSSGHVWETDDTPGGERILIKHRLGGGIELRSDGSFTSVSPNNRVTITGGDDAVIIDGHSNVVIKGDATMTVSGDYNVNVGGNYNLDVAGSEKVSVRQSSRKEIGTNQATIVKGDTETRTAGNNTDLVLGHKLSTTKLSHKILTELDLEICSNDVTITSKQNCIISAMIANITAGNISVLGVNGTIGGQNIEYHGAVYSGPYFERSGKDGEPDEMPSLDATFFGTLVGKASEAGTANFAQRADFAHAAHFANAADVAANAADDKGEGFTAWIAGDGAEHGVTDIVDPAEGDGSRYWMNHTFAVRMPETAIPDKTFISTILSTGVTSIRSVIVDANDELLDQITKVKAYDGAFNHTPTTAEVRSNFRNLSDTGADKPKSPDLVTTLVAEGRLSPSSIREIPPRTGRTAASDEPTPRFGYNVIGANPMENKSKRFTP